MTGLNAPDLYNHLLRVQMELNTDTIDPRIKYCFPQSVSPSTAAGTFDGHSFYLRARFDNVSFTMSRTPGIEAGDIDELADYDLKKIQSDARLKFPKIWVEAYKECFHVELALKKGDYEGSYMTEERKLELIRKWCREFDEMGRCEHKRLGPRIDWGDPQQDAGGNSR